MRPRLALVAVLLALPLAACTSPEATRVRAGGRGADVGNVGRVVEMHEGSRPYTGTPRLIGAWGMQDLAPARQADRSSRGEPASGSR